MNNKIAFFGASITQQKTGYVYCFQNLNSELKILQHGYGSMYLHDAAICYIDEVIKNHPDVCFIDWFSPACYRPPEKMKDYLDAIIEKLFSINCHPVFLFFYRKNMDKGWFDMFNYAKEYASDYKINSIDLSCINNADECLRDNIHTNEYGSERYAKIINDEFHKMIFLKNNKSISKNKYSNIKYLDVNQTYTEELQIKSDGQSSIIAILQNIGTYTQDIECINNNHKYIIKVKDQWSEGYERETMKINIEHFSRSIKFLIPKESKLIVKKIFYIGDDIHTHIGD